MSQQRVCRIVVPLTDARSRGLSDQEFVLHFLKIKENRSVVIHYYMVYQ